MREVSILKMQVKKLNSNAVIPMKAKKGDAGFDLFSIEDTLLKAGEFKALGTGVAIQLPPGTEGQIRPRSGLALNKGVTVLNSPGTIDEGYRGELKVILINHSKEDFQIEKDMKIAQLVIKPLLDVGLEISTELTETERGEGGFGSTGMKK